MQRRRKDDAQAAHSKGGKKDTDAWNPWIDCPSRKRGQGRNHMVQDME